MNTRGLEFKKFKHQFNTKAVKPKINNGQIVEASIKQYRNIQVGNKTPQKPPTSFRELSGSRDKNKLFSGKKSMLQNKLNTLRSNEKTSQYDGKHSTNSRTNQQNQFGSANKEGLFKRLITSRSPSSIQKTLNFDQSKGSTIGTNDSSGPSFSAFKDIVLTEQNMNQSNLVLQKTVSAGQEKPQLKGLKFKAFPHKRTNVNPSINIKNPIQQFPLLKKGPLISEKGKSRSKSKKQQNQRLSQKTKQPNIGKVIASKIQKHNTLVNLKQYQTLDVLNSSMANRSEHDEVVRSRQGSLVFDMSPTIY